MEQDQHPIVFFDGHCGLCNRTVDWVIRRDKNHLFRFAPLQGETAAKTFTDTTQEETLRNIWLYCDGALHKKSTAVLKICRNLPWPARWLSLFLAMPVPIRDWVYDLIARNRFRIWGWSETCRVPSEQERAVFLP